jgi:tRNA A-37 threonylcarbamoyl transferase component Bud32
MARDHGVNASPFFVAILKQVRDSLLKLKEQKCPTFIDEACRCLDAKSGWLYLRFDYNHSEPLKVMILQEREYNTKVLQIGRDLFPDFFERIKAIPPGSDRVILKVYDEFEMMNPSKELVFGFESTEQFISYQLREGFLPELVALKWIESHNSANTGIKINSPRLFDYGQLEMVLDDSKNYVWRILTRGCFLLQDYIQDHNDSALTQSSVTTGVEQIKQLSEIGVWHQDIKRSNLRVQSDGTIFFIDYSHVKLFDPKCNEESSRSFESMKKSFLSVMKEVGVERPVGAEFEVHEKKRTRYR